MYSCDACIHLCAMMVHVCIYMHVKMHLWSRACVWQDSCTHVTRNHAHVSDDPDTHIEYNSVIYSSMHIHFCFFIMLNQHPIDERVLYFLHTCVSLYNERTYIFVIMYICTYTCRSRERWNLWPVTSVHMYFCGACIHTCDMMVHIYTHVFGRDASVAHSCVQ